MQPPEPGPVALGAILAGGASRRFGAPKALAEVAGVAIVERVRAALEAAGALPVLVTSRPELCGLALPRRADRVGSRGPLAGIDTALRWAGERGLAGALCVACDMPFLPALLLRALLERGLRADAPAVAPVSTAAGRWEPLCAWYSRRALPAVERRLARGDGSLHDLLDALGAEPLPADVVRRSGPPEVIFMNVNTVEDLHLARRLAGEEARDGG